MKQTIKVTANATYMMKLPCVYSCHKENDELVYLLYDWDDNGQYIKAHIGDWLGEDEEGKWHILDKPERENKKKIAMEKKFCKHYLPWTNTSKEEINDACVINERRLIRRCSFRENKHKCIDFEEL